MANKWKKSSNHIVYAKSEQKNVRVPTVKGDLPLSEKEMKPRCSLGLPKWQENKLQKLSAEKLKEKGLAWVPKQVFKLGRMMFKQAVQRRQRRERD